MSSGAEASSSQEPPKAETNQDEKIMAQKEAIEDEIKRTTKLIGDRTNIEKLEEEFASDPVYLEKVKSLGSKFGHIRRTRPDGNCFYRALAFAYFEHLLRDRAEFERFRAAVYPTKEKLTEAGFPSFTSEDFYDNFMDVLDKLQPKSAKVAKLSEDSTPGSVSNGGEGQTAISLDELIEIFNEQGTSDYLVVFLRLLTSMQIRLEADFYQNFMVDGQSVVEFCNLEVEPMYHESDHIHVTAITQLIGVPVQIIYLDRGSNKEASTHSFPEDCEKPLVYLLYRPGHYDIAYPRQSSE